MCNNKSIVLFDTLMKQCTEKEIVAILGHELGHWKYSHIWCNVGIMEVYLILEMSLFQMCMNNPYLFRSFGFSTPSIFIGYKLFEMVNSGVDVFFTFAMHWLSRTFEFQADEFGVSLNKGNDLHSGLIKIAQKNKAVLNNDNLYATYHFTHPPIIQRLDRIKQLLADESRKTK